MRRRLGMLALAFLFALPGWSDDVPGAQKKQAEVGMTDSELLEVLGRPKKIARQILFRRHLEQWTYDAPPLRIELHCVRGQKARVTSVHSLLPRKE